MRKLLIILLVLFVTVTTHAFNYPTGICSKKTFRTIDSLYELYEKEDLKDGVLRNIGKECFISGFDIVVDSGEIYISLEKKLFYRLENNDTYVFRHELNGKYAGIYFNDTSTAFLSQRANGNFSLLYRENSYTIYSEGGIITFLKKNNERKRFEGGLKGSLEEISGYVLYSDIDNFIRSFEKNDENLIKSYFQLYFAENGESCNESVAEFNCTGKEEKLLICINRKEGKCYDKARAYWSHNGELTNVFQVNEDCKRHGWSKIKTCDGNWRWACRFNGREMEPSDCKGFKKW